MEVFFSAPLFSSSVSLSLCELIVGGKEGLQPVQKTIIDRCVRLVYNEYLNDPKPENMPILEDLYNLLREQEEKEAQYIATALEIYVDVYKRQAVADGATAVHYAEEYLAGEM